MWTLKARLLGICCVCCFCGFPVLSLSAKISLDQLTLEQKVGQVLMVHFNGTDANLEASKLIENLHVGGFIYYNWSNELSSPEQVKKLSEGLQQIATKNKSYPLLISTDQEGGRVSRLKNGFTSFPNNQTMGMTHNPEIAEQNAYRMGLEMKTVGVNMDLAPVVDVNSNPENPSIGDRAYSADPQEVVIFAKHALAGFKKAGVISTLKHFPGYGDVTVDPHAGLPVVDKSREELNKVELYPYYHLVSDAQAIMTAHIMMPSLDKEKCATLSKPILTGVLRNGMGFKGLIISDSLVMEGILKQAGSADEASVLALEAGCDMLILGGKQLLSTQAGFELSYEDVVRIHGYIVKAVREGRLSQDRLDDAVVHVLALKDSFNTETK